MAAAPRPLTLLSLELASTEALAPLLRAAVEGLAERGAALARIWLLDPEPGGNTLRLAASAGRPRAERGADWTRVDGSFQRFRVGTGKVGTAAASAHPVAVRDVQRGTRRISRPAWARREGIHGFAAIPLASRGRVLGVLGVFRRDLLDERGLEALCDVADHLGAGLRRALAFGELELRAHALEREARGLREALATARALGPATARAVREILTDAEVRALERENLQRVLEVCSGRIYGASGAAARLVLRPTTLASRLRALGIERPPRVAPS